MKKIEKDGAKIIAFLNTISFCLTFASLILAAIFIFLEHQGFALKIISFSISFIIVGLIFYILNLINNEE